MTDAYAAGLIDGEGCIYISAYSGGKQYGARIDVGMSARALRLLEAMQANYGGSIRKTRKRSDRWEAAYAWSLFGKPAADFLRRVHPHLLLKSEQARLAIRLHDMLLELPKHRNGSTAWTSEGRSRAEAMRRRIQELNQKGPQDESEPGWFARLVGGQWVTPQRDLFSDLGYQTYSGTWPRAGMTRSGTAFRLPPLVPRTSVIGSGSWPTPDASVFNDGESAETWLARRERLKAKHMNGNGAGMPLAIAVQLGPGAMRWPTPRSTDGERGGRGDLIQAVRGNPNSHYRLWPTPNAADSLGGRRAKMGSMTMTGRIVDGRKRSVPLASALSLTGHNGPLNPAWVELLMGYPLGWTELGPATGSETFPESQVTCLIAYTDSEDSATP